jgi:hypothetical protein
MAMADGYDICVLMGRHICRMLMHDNTEDTMTTLLDFGEVFFTATCATAG